MTTPNKKTTNTPEALRAMLKEALWAYEQARSVRLQAGRRADEKLRSQTSALDAEQRGQTEQLQAAHQRQMRSGQAEQERLGHLLAEVEVLEQAARALLEQAGLAHMAGAPNQIAGDPAPVGQYPKGASPYGCLDMAGNVWEWCDSRYESGGYVLRGGCFANDASPVCCAARYWDYPYSRNFDCGFRVVAPSF